MFGKMIKLTIGLALLVLIGGGLLLGPELLSYVQSSHAAVQRSVKSNVPVTFELQRARDMVEQIIPELQANIRVIAHEEVEIASLEKQIAQAQKNISDERQKMVRLRGKLQTQQVSYTFAGNDYTHDQVKRDLARRFDRFKESESMLVGKNRLMETRKKSLSAAIVMLEQARQKKSDLEQQIESLAGQYRLVQASSTIGTSAVSVDNSKIAEAQKLIGNIKKRLDVAERVLAHQANFVQEIDVDSVDEQDLIAEMDDYFSNQAGGNKVLVDKQPVSNPIGE